MRGHLSGSSPLEPFLGLSQHLSRVALCGDGAGLSPGAHFTDEDVETLSVLVGFVQQLLLGGNREEPQPFFPILLSPHLDCALPSL